MAASSSSSSSSSALYYTVKVVLVGDSGVGKTSLAVRYVRDEFHPFQEPTIGAAFVSKTQEITCEENKSGAPADGQQQQVGGDGQDRGRSSRRNPHCERPPKKYVHMKIWDTAGQERYQSLTPLYFRGAGACVLVYDVCRLHSFQALSRWIREIKNYDSGSHNPRGMVLIIAGNKCDLDSERSVRKVDAEAFAMDHGAHYVETSAKTGANVTKLFRELARRAAQDLAPDPPQQQEGPDGRVDLSAGSSSYSATGSCCYSSPNSQLQPTTIME